MRRYLDPSTPTPSGRYGLTLTEVPHLVVREFRRGFRCGAEAPLTPEQCLALVSYQRPTSRIACCPIPTPIAPSDATEWVR